MPASKRSSLVRDFSDHFSSTKRMSVDERISEWREDKKHLGIRHSVHVSGTTRPSRAASMILDTMEVKREEEEDVPKLWFIPLTNNVKALFLMMILFTVICIAQVIAAEAANSKALLADAVTMGVDAASYLGNIFGECSSVPEKKIVMQLFFSLLSIVALIAVNVWMTMESVDALQGEEEEGEGVVAWMLLLFAIFGIIFDFISLGVYYISAKKDAEKAYEEQEAAMIEAGDAGGDEEARVKKPGVNMLSALLHVGADFLRSGTTLVTSIILMTVQLSTAAEVRLDAIATLIICATVFLGAAYAMYEWIVEFWGWFQALGEHAMLSDEGQISMTTSLLEGQNHEIN